VAARFEALGATLTADEADVLVVDGAALFASAAGVEAVRAALDGAWDAIQPAAQNPMLILLLAPPPGDAHAEAARAGLENLARTLSIEWARLGIRPVAIHPGTDTPAGEVAELAAFLASPAGAYYSGCRFDLR
jgi:NAD(P)-dependent dehydrogenase (short-subunit alcohol dehydrogenase family)